MILLLGVEEEQWRQEGPNLLARFTQNTAIESPVYDLTEAQPPAGADWIPD